VKDCAPSTFLKSMTIMALYVCFMFCIFNRLVLEEYVFQIKGGPHLLQLCFCALQDSLPFTAREMHPSFESLAITNTPSL
jgi:hypothetical protein